MLTAANAYRKMIAEQKQALEAQKASQKPVEPILEAQEPEEKEAPAEAPENIGSHYDKRKSPRLRVWVNKHGHLYKGRLKESKERLLEDAELDQIKQQGDDEIEQAKEDAEKQKVQKKVDAVKAAVSKTTANTASI